MKRLVEWFMSTLGIGLVIGIVLAKLIEWGLNHPIFGSFSEQILLSLTLAAVAELGFFGYLVFVWLGKGMFRDKKNFDWMLAGTVLLVLGSVLYSYIKKYSDMMLCLQLLVPFVIVVVSFLVGYLKVRWTNGNAFMLTVFFLIVGTFIEAFPSFHSKAGELPLEVIWHTVGVLLICNAWQILRLQKWTSR